MSKLRMTKPSALGDGSGILNLSLLASSSQILSSAESPRGKSHPPVHNRTVPKPVCVLGVMGGECGGAERVKKSKPREVVWSNSLVTEPYRACMRSWVPSPALGK